MANNVKVTPGSAADPPIATDDVGGVMYQRVKVDVGVSGATTPLLFGQAAAASSVPVVLASDQPTVNVGAAVSSGATDTGSPVKIGFVYRSTLPTFTDGQRGDGQMGTRGSLGVQIMEPDSANPISVAANSVDSVAGTARSLGVRAWGYVFNGTNWDRTRGSLLAGVIVKPYAFPASDWSYAAASGGISNTTTAVTIKAAGSVVNYVTNIQLSSDALGVATEVAIRDGAGGTVLWRMKIGTAGIINGISIDFLNPIRSTSATLLEFVTLTASVTGAVFFNAQGYSA